MSLIDFNDRVRIMTEMVRQVAKGYATSLYVYGRAGIGKTHTIGETLDNEGVEWYEFKGHCAPIGFFQLLQGHPDSVIVIDDVNSLFGKDISNQMIMAATERKRNGGSRIIEYRKKDEVHQCIFRGGVIAVSNLSLEKQDSETFEAIKSRMLLLNFDPTSAEVWSKLESIAEDYINGAEVLAWLKEVSEKYCVPPEVRIFVDKCLPAYRFWTNEGGIHWKEMVETIVMQMVERPSQNGAILSKNDEVKGHIALALQIEQEYGTREERINAWMSATGKSQSSFYLRLKEAKALPK